MSSNSVKIWIICLCCLLCSSSLFSSKNYNDLSTDIDPVLVTNYLPTSASAEAYPIQQMKISQLKNQVKEQNLIDLENQRIEAEKEKEKELLEEAEENKKKTNKTYYYNNKLNKVMLKEAENLIDDKAKVICKLNNSCYKKLRILIEEKSDYLFNRSIPAISFNMGTRLATDQFGSDQYQYPAVSASISVPLYEPDLDATRAQRLQMYLEKMLGKLNTLETNYNTFLTLQKKLKFLKSLFKKTKDIKLIDSIFDSEIELIKLISSINSIVRYFDITYNIKIETWVI